MKKQFIICFILLVLLISGCQKGTADNTAEKGTIKGKHHAEIEVKDYGTIKVELDADNAPISVNNFMDLANDGFYDGLSFHRIIKGFMIQGGAPKNNDTGKSIKPITGEFSENNIENPLSHTRGAISMARLGNDPNSATSQFFIVHEDSTHLDGSYAAFGYVTDGMDIVDRICEDTQVQDDNGTVKDSDQPIITTIRVVD